MKKLTTIFAALALVISMSAFAAPEVTVNEAIRTSFAKKFANAKNVQWEKNSDYYFAHFTLNNDDLIAAYDEEGNMIASSKIITKEKLPLFIKTSLLEQFTDYTISPTVSQINLLGEDIYFVSIENKKFMLRLRCSADGAVFIEKKARKPVLVGKVY